MKTSLNSQQGKFHSLSRRIVAQFCLFTLVLSLLFSLISFILLYTLEDSFIEREIGLEADYLVEHYQQTQQWPEPRSAYLSLHFAKQTLPSDIREIAIAEPKRREFYGEHGKHYHLLPLRVSDDTYLLAEVSDKLMVRPIRSGVLTLFVVSGLSLTSVAFFIAWRIGRKTAQPLKQLADLVDGVAPEHIPKQFANQFPNNEIGILARTLESSMRQIVEALERERCFTRDVSHELRTPVAVIKNGAELYMQKNQQATDQEGNRAIVQRIYDASLQIEQTVTTLLHLAREEHTSVEHSSVQLLPLIEQSIIEHSYLIADKPIEVEVSDNCNAKVIAQSGMLKVLLDNLLSNAFQYTEQGIVAIGFSENKLTISDTGPGIEPDISQSVTEVAVKGSQSTGYGFGLSIVKRLCQHQNWQLEVISEQGTQISVTFTA